MQRSQLLAHSALSASFQTRRRFSLGPDFHLPHLQCFLLRLRNERHLNCSAGLRMKEAWSLARTLFLLNWRLGFGLGLPLISRLRASGLRKTAFHLKKRSHLWSCCFHTGYGPKTCLETFELLHMRYSPLLCEWSCFHSMAFRLKANRSFPAEECPPLSLSYSSLNNERTGLSGRAFCWWTCLKCPNL